MEYRLPEVLGVFNFPNFSSSASLNSFWLVCASVFSSPWNNSSMTHPANSQEWPFPTRDNSSTNSWVWVTAEPFPLHSLWNKVYKLKGTRDKDVTTQRLDQYSASYRERKTNLKKQLLVKSTVTFHGNPGFWGLHLIGIVSFWESDGTWLAAKRLHRVAMPWVIQPSAKDVLPLLTALWRTFVSKQCSQNPTCQSLDL